MYDLLRAGALAPHAIPLYRRELLALARAGVVTRTPDGSFAVPADTSAPRPATIHPPAPFTPSPRPVLRNLNVRVPPEVHEALDMLAQDRGVDRSEVVREIFADVLPRLIDARTQPSRPTRSGTHRINTPAPSGDLAASDIS